MQNYSLTKKLSLKNPNPTSITNPGVYIFRDQDQKPLYIGKAKNLKSRLDTYFANRLGGKTALMVQEAKFISVIKVASELEALLLEAVLVRRHLPKYNSQLRDDKSPLYIGLTKESLPRVLTFRKKGLKEKELQALFGPYVSSTSVKIVLKLLRRVFPFGQHKPGRRACFYNQIGLCNPCPSIIENERKISQKKALTRKYLANIRNIKKALSGKLNSLEKSLTDQMTKAAKEEKYEKAEGFKKQLEALGAITTPTLTPELYLSDPHFLTDIRKREIESLKQKLPDFLKVKSLRRIECFDVAHLSGTKPTASMVVFIKGEAENGLYRHFRVLNKKNRSDTDSLKEIIRRRQGHFVDWGKPNLIIIDGGKPQVSAVQEVEKTIPVIGLAKKEETLVFKFKDKFSQLKLGKSPARNLVQRARDEAHRFARRYHHHLVAKHLATG